MQNKGGWGCEAATGIYTEEGVSILKKIVFESNYEEGSSSQGTKGMFTSEAI